MKAATTVRRRLSVLAQSVNLQDMLKVEVFLRVAQGRLRCDWQVSTTGEAHLLLLGGDEPTTIPGLLDDPISQFQLVDGPGASFDGQQVLTRPLQYEAFVDALLAVEDKLLPKTPPAAPVPMMPATAGRLATLAADGRQPWATGRFRLSRWPSAGLLQPHRYGVRLATFLSVRPVTLDELARLCNVDSTECAKFVDAMGHAGLLSVAIRVAPPSRAALATTGVSGERAEAHGAATSADSSLVSRLRRSLGISNKRSA